MTAQKASATQNSLALATFFRVALTNKNTHNWFDNVETKHPIGGPKGRSNGLHPQRSAKCFTPMLNAVTETDNQFD